jgi:hypothetical protein
LQLHHYFSCFSHTSSFSPDLVLWRVSRPELSIGTTSNVCGRLVGSRVASRFVLLCKTYQWAVLYPSYMRPLFFFS